MISGTGECALIANSTNLKEYASELGFDAVGLTTAEPFLAAQRMAEDRIDAGLLECFTWFTRERLIRGCNPTRLMESAATVISLAASYADVPVPTTEDELDPLRGRISRYAMVDDYHVVMGDRIGLLSKLLERAVDRPIQNRIYVDTGPMLERAVAQRSGVGWFGKNTNVLVPSIGSYVFLGELITSVPLDPDVPLARSCGACRACLAACPTGALVAPYTLDARRCISYLTIELKGWIPRDRRSSIGRWVFGCDACQVACPVNSRARTTSSNIFSPVPTVGQNPKLTWLLTLGEEEYRASLRRTALSRAKRQGLRRNAAVALGNSRDRSAASHLIQVLQEDPDDVVRGHAAWALGQLGGVQARRALEKARRKEATGEIKADIEAALNAL